MQLIKMIGWLLFAIFGIDVLYDANSLSEKADSLPSSERLVPSWTGQASQPWHHPVITPPPDPATVELMLENRQIGTSFIGWYSSDGRCLFPSQSYCK
jgi:hypothetical protein